MIERLLTANILEGIQRFPAVAILGPRQVGKTTLALSLKGKVSKPLLYLDLERPSDLNRLADPELYFQEKADHLIILDEIHRLPSVFPLLRSLVDERRRNGDFAAHFIILGSASLDLLRQASETLAGRIAYYELKSFSIIEAATSALRNHRDRLWVRGGFPDSFLAKTERTSEQWREHFISTYIERDIPQFGPRIPAIQLRRFWTMLCHHQGGLLNASQLGAGLGLTGKTISSYLDLLADLYLIRQLPPWSRNIGKRLVKAPKVYVRDSGLLHSLTGIGDLDILLGHPLCGPSWEGFVIENLLAAVPSTWQPYFFRTSAGAEIDLLLEKPDGKVIAIEIKRTLQPKLSKGFCLGCVDVQAHEGFYVMPEGESYLLDAKTTAISMETLMARFHEESYSSA